MSLSSWKGRVLVDAPDRWSERFVPRRADLPADVAFLRAFGIGERVLASAVRSAGRTGISACEALVAGGEASEGLVFFSLAEHLGCDYERSWPDLAADADAIVALKTWRVRLKDGRWLIAPNEAGRNVLLAAGRRPDLVPPDIVLTSPSHFQAIIRRTLPHQLARAASDALADAAPDLSARAACGPAKIAAWCLAGACCLAGVWVGLQPLVDATAVLFLAALVFRLLVSAAGLEQSPEPEPEPIGDAHLPIYSVLVPLFEEAAMVPSLVTNLDALDYPRAKLDVIFLVEARDATTRLALLTASVPSHMRVFVVPDGEPRTKPRALNAGLLVARGDLVTVFDAEDRPDPAQLRLAAARFAKAPANLACLQARLAISNADRGLLPRLFAVEYAALFDLYNVGTARLGLPFAIGGTSNHFRGMG